MKFLIIVEFIRDFITYDIIQYAVIAGVLIGIIAPLIGSVVVIRRLSFIADTLSHFSLAGVTFGAFLGNLIASSIVSENALFLGIVFSVGGTLLIEYLRGFYKNYKELSMPIVLSLGVALSGIFIAAPRQGLTSARINSLLFGSIYTVHIYNLILILIISLAILIFILLNYKKIITLCFDETFARVSGINVKRLQFAITIILALFISIFMEIIGVLLIGSLMIIPVASSILVSNSFKNAAVNAIIISQFSVLSGFVISYGTDLPTGAVIVLINVLLLFAVMITKRLGRRLVKKKPLKA